jgi:hypothetical protein
MRSVHPWDFRCDPLRGSFHPDEVRWCAFRRLHLMDEVKRNPRLTMRDDLRPTSAIGFLKMRDARKDELSPDVNHLVEEWVIWDKQDRMVFSLSPGTKSTLMQPRDWPVGWRTLPYSLLQLNPTPDDPFGCCYSAQVLPLQIELNKTLTIANRLVQSLRRVIPYRKDALADGEEKKLSSLRLLEFIGLNGDLREAFGQIQLGGFPQELLLHMRLLVDQIREIVGVSEMERGQRINVETAAEVGGVSAGAATQRSRNQGPWEEFLQDAIGVYATTLQEVVTDEFAIPILGPEDARSLFGGDAAASPFLMVGGPKSSIQGEFLYLVRPGSTLPRDPSAEIKREVALNEAMVPFGSLVNLPQRAIDTLRAFDKDPARNLQSPEQIQATQQVQSAEGLPPGTPVESPPQTVSPMLAGMSRDLAQ